MEDKPNTTPSNSKTVIFMVALSFICALILSTLASALRTPQEIAKELDRSKQMLIAARIIHPNGYFLIQTKNGDYEPAKYDRDGILAPGGSPEDVATKEQILAVHRSRMKTFLVDDKGKSYSFEEVGLDEGEYTSEYRKIGYYNQRLKLIYKILPNAQKEDKKDGAGVEGYTIPINGMGLWDAIYGYLAIKTDGNTVIGISWYDQKETPGLGANIAEAEWQSQFPGKHIFQATQEGKTDFEAAQLGIVVVKGKVNEVLGSSPKTKSAVDGMAGATLTGNGVTDAYKTVLTAYRPFLKTLYSKDKNEEKTTQVE